MIDLKRDMDLVRYILEQVESRKYEVNASELVNGRHDEAEVVYHVRIMKQAGLLDARIEDDLSGNHYAIIFGLTWDGQEFLSLVRDSSVWSKIKTEVMNKTGSLSFEVLKELALFTVKGLVISSN